MGKELEASMKDQYKEIINAVNKYSAEYHRETYITGYSQAIEDAINVLPETTPNIEVVKLNMRKLKKLL